MGELVTMDGQAKQSVAGQQVKNASQQDQHALLEQQLPFVQEVRQIMPSSTMDGSMMPPHQVYMNPGEIPPHMQDALQQQFKAMTMADPTPVVENGNEQPQDDDVDNDEEATGEDPVKLFVGQVRTIVYVLRSHPDVVWSDRWRHGDENGRTSFTVACHFFPRAFFSENFRIVLAHAQSANDFCQRKHH